MTTATDSTQARRVELILRQIDSLPTLPAVATRLLSLTANDDTNAREVIQLVSSDQTLTAKILSMCRKADRGVRDEAMTIDKAVVLLGFNAIRNAVLSIKVFELFDDPEKGSKNVLAGLQGDVGTMGGQLIFDRENFWRHSLAVGIAAELIAIAHPGHADLPPSEAFVCGLMHDVGKLALDYVLPKSYGRVIELTEVNQGDIAAFERRVMGVDHHTVGKRLSEQWLLPYWIQDCIWLHGSDFETLPKLGHRRMIGLVGLADVIVRRNHIGYSGNFTFNQDPAAMARELGLNPSRVDSITRTLHEESHRRSDALGLNEKPSQELFVQSIQQANQVLGRLNNALERRTGVAARQAQVLEAITAFHGQASPGRSVGDVLDAIVLSAMSVLGPGYYAMLWQSRDIMEGDLQRAWLVCQYNERGGPVSAEFVESPPYSPDLSSLGAGQSGPATVIGVLPWLTDHVSGVEDYRNLQLLPLDGGWATVALLVHDRPSLPPHNQMQALSSSWGAAVAGAMQHEGARRLGEDLAQANRDLADTNRRLADTQEKLLRSESMARLGEMAAGAAHEMNNPLAVISGRAQLLAMSLSPGSKEQTAAQTVVEQSHRLSDLISSMRMFSDPPKPVLRPTDVAALLDTVVKNVKRQQPSAETKKPISLQIRPGLPPVVMDPDQIGVAVTDLLVNALQSLPKTAVHVTAHLDATDPNLVIQITDDGKGMDAYTLAHAMDPFFSAKPAGRQMGMGLTRAQIHIKAHQGDLTLKSSPNAGTVATVTLSLDSAG